jgi:hypothetical protein
MMNEVLLPCFSKVDKEDVGRIQRRFKDLEPVSPPVSEAVLSNWCLKFKVWNSHNCFLPLPGTE